MGELDRDRPTEILLTELVVRFRMFLPLMIGAHFKQSRQMFS